MEYTKLSKLSLVSLKYKSPNFLSNQAENMDIDR
jgi:hypothetical protein